MNPTTGSCGSVCGGPSVRTIRWPRVLRQFLREFHADLYAGYAGFGGPAEYAYQLMIRNTSRNEELISELEKIEGMENINLTMQEKLLEV